MVKILWVPVMQILSMINMDFPPNVGSFWAGIALSGDNILQNTEHVNKRIDYPVKRYDEVDL